MSFNVIPAIDLLDGKVVRLAQGKYDAVTHYQFTPAELAKLYEENGATRIHIVDLDGAKARKPVNISAIESIRHAVTCELEVGGGIRSIESLQLMKTIGINYFILGSLLVKDRPLSDTLISAFPNTILAGIDCHGTAVATEGWEDDSNIQLKELVTSLENSPIAGIIFTDISTDGMLCGPNISALTQVAALTTHPVIASGGIRNREDILELRTLVDSGIKGCILGKAIMENRIPLDQLFRI